MTATVRFHTFHEMVGVMSQNVPHALVQDMWSRLERVIRTASLAYGAKDRAPISNLIDHCLSKHPVVTREVICELHQMRSLRNQCAHGRVPPLCVEEASAYAYRAWDILSAIAWNRRDFLALPSRPLDAHVPTA